MCITKFFLTPQLTICYIISARYDMSAFIIPNLYRLPHFPGNFLVNVCYNDEDSMIPLTSKTDSLISLLNRKIAHRERANKKILVYM